MASTWSALKVELQGTGDNPGTWGTATNVNLGDAVLGEAITGSATVDFASDADVTITLTDSVASQSARNLRLNITESSGIGSVRNLILGSGCQIEKFYLINNTGTGAKTVKNTSGTGISVPAGKATLVYNNGTNVVDAASYFTSLTLGSALPITSGGTGTTSTTFANLTTNVTGTLPIANGGTGTTSTTFANLTTNVTGTLPIANGGTGTTSTTFANLTTNVTGLLPIANGGTATATPALVQGTGVTITGTWPNQTINATGTGGTVTSVGGTGTVNGISLSGSVTTSGSLTLGGTLSGVNLASQITGTLPVANGGTGLTAGTSGGVLAYTAAGTLASSAALTANNVVVGGGAGAAPSSTNLLAISAAVTTGNYIKAIGYADTVTALGNTGTAINLDVTSGGVFTATLNGSATITLRYPVATGASSFILILTNDATPGRTVAFSGGTFKYPGGSVTRTTTANAIDIWFFFTPDGGTTYYASIPMANLS